MEIELKSMLFDGEEDRIRRTVEAQGHEFGPPVKQRDIYYKERGFRGKPQGEGSYVIRIRYADDGSSLNMKRLTDRDGAWEETEADVSDGEAVEKILQTIGLEMAATVTKSRQSSQFKEVEVLLDKVEELGMFVEVSLISEDAERAQGCLKAVLREFGIDESRLEFRGYPTIILEREGVVFLRK